MITIHTELYSSKNSKQIFFNKKTQRNFVAKSTASKNNELVLLDLLAGQKDNFLYMLKGKEMPYIIEFKIYRKTKRRFDYTNIIQGLCDCMTKIGMIEDDNANVMIPRFAPYEVDSQNPRVEIKVL